MSKGLETLQEIKSKPFSWEKLKDNLDTIEKELKSWDIVSEYVDVFQDRNGVYYMLLNGYGIPITEKQYNVLKEAIE